MAEGNKVPEQIARCALCADMCKYSCPTYLATGRETLSPQKMARLIVYNEKGFLEDEEGFLDLMFQSAMCGACKRHCIYADYDLRKFMQGARVKAFAKGIIPEEVRKRVEAYKKFGNPHGEREFLEKGTGEFGYFISCSSYKDKDLLQAMDRVISTAGIKLKQYGGGNICCGAPLYYAGDMDGFKEAALRMKAEIEKRRLKKLVVDCPTCVKTMTETYRETGINLDVEVIHTTQFLHALFMQDRLHVKKSGRTVTFHDPCILANDLGLATAPREIVTAMGFKLKEPVYAKEHTHCCGGAYGAKIGDRPLRDAVTSMRVNELRETAADIYVSACPTCKAVLSDIGIKYITELVAERVTDG